MSGYYISKPGGEIAKVPNIQEWAKWHELRMRPFLEGGKRVALTYIGKAYVSTVFLGIDHNWNPNGIPVLFETMIFDTGDEELGDYQERYATHTVALEGHERAVKLVREKLGEAA